MKSNPIQDYRKLRLLENLCDVFREVMRVPNVLKALQESNDARRLMRDAYMIDIEIKKLEENET